MRNDRKRLLPWRMGIALSLSLVQSDVAMATPLDLATAESLAVAADPGIRQRSAQAEALFEGAISAAQLPDPKLKLGAMAVPLDTFDLDQEPMTQLQVGFQQHFPPGDTLALRGRKLTVQAQAQLARAETQRRLVLRNVREDYLELLYQRRAETIVHQARVWFDQLLAVSQDHFASGRGQQQDVFRAQLELSRLDDRIGAIRQQQEIGQARLAMWIGCAADRPLADQWPRLTPPTLTQLDDALSSHPQLQVWQRQVAAAELAVDVSRQQYKSGWTLDVTYGDRSGQSIDGTARADFISAMVIIELPLFRGRRQDRNVAAGVKQVDAAVAGREDAYRHLQRMASQQSAVLARLEQRLDLFDQRLLPDAEANSGASLTAYQSGVGDFAALTRARITEYELHIEHLRLRIDYLIAVARLLYLAGGEDE